MTLKAAQAGYLPGARGGRNDVHHWKGCRAGLPRGWKVVLTAAEAGNTPAATNYVGSLRSNMENLRIEPELSARWSKFLMAHREYSPVPGR